MIFSEHVEKENMVFHAVLVGRLYLCVRLCYGTLYQPPTGFGSTLY